MTRKLWKRFSGWKLPTKISFIAGIIAISGLLFLPLFEGFSTSLVSKLYQTWHDDQYYVFIETDRITNDIDYLNSARREGHTIIKLPYSEIYGINSDFYTVINSRVDDLMLRKNQPMTEWISTLDFSDYYSMNLSHTIWKFKIHNKGKSSLSNSKLNILFTETKILNFSASCSDNDLKRFNFDPNMLFLQFRKINFPRDGICIISVEVDSIEIPSIQFTSNEKPLIDLIEPGTVSFIFDIVKTDPPIVITISYPKYLDPLLQNKLNNLTQFYTKNLSRDVLINITYPADEFKINYSNVSDESLIKDIKNLLMS